MIPASTEIATKFRRDFGKHTFPMDHFRTGMGSQLPTFLASEIKVGCWQLANCELFALVVLLLVTVLVAFVTGLVAFVTGLVAFVTGLVAFVAGLVALVTGLVAHVTGLVAFVAGLVA